MEPFVLDAAFVRFLLPQEAQSQATNGGEVGSTVAVLLSAGVFSEAHVQHPVLAVFDGPVTTDRRGKQFGLRRMTRDV